MKVYGYARVNNRRVQSKNLSIRKQTNRIENYAAARGWELEKIFSDTAETSVSLELPHLKKIIELAEQEEIDILVVARLDRVTRSIRTFQQFLQKVLAHGVVFVSIEETLDSSTESGRLALQTLQWVAKWDSKMISDRTKELVERKRSVGERVGHAPFGFVYEKKKLIPFLKELQVVYLIREKRNSEELSYHKIAKLLNESHIPAKRGGKWYAETIKTIYENSLYDDTALKQLVQSS